MKSQHLIALLALALAPFAHAQEFNETVNADIVEFHIKPGTGSGPWNTLETPIMARVGQTLRFINDDSVPHQLHTFGSPCPHARKAFKPSEVYDCVISSTHQANAGDVYDHIYGSSAQIYIQAE